MAFRQDFINMLSVILPDGERDALLSALEGEPEVSIRFNPKVYGAEKTILENLGCDAAGSVPWADGAVYLNHRPHFTMDPQFHQGCYYVQEASSMFLAHAVKRCVNRPVRALDLCAAPGGKSTLLASLLPAGSLLISNEVQRSRAQILAENMVKWGQPGVMVTCNTPKQIGESSLMFDLIAVDAPCSGEGMFRKDEVAVSEWRISNVDMCAARQREIIEDIWPALKPGGYLIYSTCTFNTHENEENVRWMMERFGAVPINLEPPVEWNITGSLTKDPLPVYHFMQHRTRGEGFFICLLQKKGEVTGSPGSRTVRQDSAKVPAECKTWLRDEESLRFFIRKESLYAVPSSLANDMWIAGNELYALVPGIEVAVMKGHDWVPAHALAMSSALNRNAFNCVEVTRQQALEYLHCDALRLGDVPKGIVLLTYKDIPLGFAKNIGNRANNMYPQEWRIRNAIA